jgi:hypothetical protein
MSTEVPSIKLPNSASGFFLLIHTVLLFYWLYNRLDSTSYLLPLSISGMAVGWIMYYFVGTHLDIELKEGRSHSEIFDSAITYWFLAIVAYVILYFLLKFIIFIMQPPAPTAWPLH